MDGAVTGARGADRLGPAVPPRLVRVALTVIFTGAVLHAVVCLAIGLEAPLTDLHAFRQTQTALSAWRIAEGGPLLAYETPVFGPHSSIPFELPLFQWLAALVHVATGLPLDPSGRLVSIAAFLLTLPLASVILGTLGVPRHYRLVFLSLLLCSPLFLYWSRTFMIETTALALGVAYLAAALTAFERPAPTPLAVALLAGVLCATVKVTTFPVFGLLAALLGLLPAWRRSRVAGEDASHRLKTLATPGLALLAVPAAAAAWWTAFADAHKLAAPLAADVLTSSALRRWNFGTLAQRVSTELWGGVVWHRIFSDLVGWSFVVPAAVALVLVARRRRVAVLGSLLAFAAPLLVFTNLHRVHSYYQVANGLFLLAAVGFALLAAFEGARSRAAWVASCGLLLVVLGLESGRYHAAYLRAVRGADRTILDTAAAVDGATRPGDVILVYGLDWSSELAYLARRPAVMVPWWAGPDDPRLEATLDALPEGQPALVAFCRDARGTPDLVSGRIGALGLDPEPFRTDAHCNLYRPAGRTGERPAP